MKAENTSDGFVFEFGSSESDGRATCGSSDADAVGVPSFLGEFVTLSEIAQTWLGKFVTQRRAQLELPAIGAAISYQVPPRVEALEGSGKHPRDIVPGKYYGGLKIWSCAPDLALYLQSHREVVQGRSVLEVGCGQAVPLIAAMLCGATRIVGHDFNREVIELCALPNIAASYSSNTSCISPTCVVRTGYGDWDTLFQGCSDEIESHVDVVLGSDVTYDPVACRKLAHLLVRILPRSSIALIATKQYYFGTNGGLSEFEAAAREASGGHFDVVRMATFGDGHEMQRHIVSVRWKV